MFKVHINLVLKEKRDVAVIRDEDSTSKICAYIYSAYLVQDKNKFGYVETHQERVYRKEEVRV